MRDRDEKETSVLAHRHFFKRHWELVHHLDAVPWLGEEDEVVEQVRVETTSALSLCHRTLLQDLARAEQAGWGCQVEVLQLASAMSFSYTESNTYRVRVGRELQHVRECRQLLLIFVGPNGLVDRSKDILHDAQRLYQLLMIFIRLVRVSNDLQYQMQVSHRGLKTLVTHLIDQKGISCQSLHRLQKEMLQLKVLDS